MIKKFYPHAMFLVIIFLITGCDYFNQSMVDYLKEWTNTALISKHSFDGSYPETGGMANLPSGGDRVIFEDNKGSFAVTDLEGKVILTPREGTLTVLQSDWEGGGSWLAVCTGPDPVWDIYTWDGVLSATVQGDSGNWCSMAGDLIEICSDRMAAYYRPEDGSCVRRGWFGLPG